MLDANDDYRFQRAIDFLVEFHGPIRRNLTWVDLGCHQGQFLKKVIDQYGVKGSGLDDWDPSQKGAADARWDYARTDLDKELPCPPDVDVVSAFEVLEHIIDTDGFLGRIFDRLRPGGYFVLSTPNINSLRNRVAVPFGAYPVGLEHRTVVHHVRLYNVPVLSKHLAEIGFRDIEVSGVAFLPMRFAVGRGSLSGRLASLFPSLCANILAVCRKPP